MLLIMGNKTDKGLVRGFGERLRQLRTDAGLTQEQLGARSDLQPESVSRIERGLTQASLTVLVALADGLGCTVGELVQEQMADQPQLAGLEVELVRRFRAMNPEARSHLVSFLRLVRQP